MAAKKTPQNTVTPDDPKDYTAEQDLIGSLFIRPELVAYTQSQQFHTGDLSDLSNRLIFQSILSVLSRQNGQEPTLSASMVIRELKTQHSLTDIVGFDEVQRPRNGEAYIHWLSDCMPTAEIGVVDDAIRAIQEKAARRKAINECVQTITLCRDSTISLDKIHNRLATSAQTLHIAKNEIAIDAKTLVGGAMARFYKAREGGGKRIIGVPMGIPIIDYATLGFQPGYYCALAARTGDGKTRCMIQSIAYHSFLTHQAKTYLRMLEMSKERAMDILLCQIAQIDIRRFNRGILPPGGEEEKRLLKAYELIADSEEYLEIDDRPISSMAEFRADCILQKERRDIDIIYVDYLQKMRDASNKFQSRQLELQYCSEQTRQIAKLLKIPIVALLQLLRTVETRAKREPKIEDIRECGDIEHDLDLIMFIWRHLHNPKFDEKEHTVLMDFDELDPLSSDSWEHIRFKIAKQREGDFPLYLAADLHKPFMTFYHRGAWTQKQEDRDLYVQRERDGYFLPAFTPEAVDGSVF